MSSSRLRRSLLTVAAGATAATVIGFGGPAVVAPPSRPASLLPRAAAATLPEFTDCEELRQWYVETALPRVGPWGFGSVFAFAADRASEPSAGALADQAVGSSDTGTNVQEAGVDEPDLAKTDGEILVRVARQDLLVVDVSGERARPLSRTPLPGPRGGLSELLLVDDTVLVVGTETWWGPFVDASFRAAVPGVQPVRTHLVAVDVSTPSSPVVASHQRVDGTLVGAREYGDGTVRAVVTTGLPQLDFVHPTPARSGREAVLENRRVVRSATVDDWLPGIRHGDGRGRHPLLDCGDVRHPEKDAGPGTLSVLTFGIDDPRGLTATAVTAAGDLAYSSSTRLFVATLNSGAWDAVPLGDPVVPRGLVRRTQVHAFDLSGGATSYVASGSVPGTVRDRWSFSEHEGRLRVATALGRGWMPRENAVHVLEESSGRLRVVGSVKGLGPGEQVQSVRWLGDLAVVVTFRQTDPLYTVDLSDPADPRVLGALKIRGFSAYLHPVGEGLLLGLGRDATKRGVDLGGQAAVFDLDDLGRVVRTATTAFGRSAELGTRWEPRAFTYMPEQRLALVPVETWDRPSVRLVALRVGPAGQLTRAASWPVGRWGASSVRALPLDDGWVAVVHHGVRLVRIR
ncbi:MAG TPA: beta-propeller domain-containing protein [Nocardioides sp.]|uniref:beta-propeller domain-containing protein n=1 Tax=Nocardioides sp. TaxID=35761 RepID=UPI002D7F9B64|nr:beta-propeller domain-containing protein [Nocardioides sp.]HET6652135.1 beta-propeller domain-containing protein [Nocardioides sp.]